jgi:hypothetical protein
VIALLVASAVVVSGASLLMIDLWRRTEQGQWQRAAAFTAALGAALWAITLARLVAAA